MCEGAVFVAWRCVYKPIKEVRKDAEHMARKVILGKKGGWREESFISLVLPFLYKKCVLLL